MASRSSDGEPGQVREVAIEGGIIIDSKPSALTTAGFTALIGFPIPAAGYKLQWSAVGNELGEVPESELPEGATALEPEIKYAWLMQCQAIWNAADPLGLGLSDKEAGAKIADAMAKLELLPFVKESLQGHIRYALT